MEGFLSFMQALNDKVIWSPFLVYLCLGSGLYFSIRSRFLQVRLLKPMVKLLFKGEKSEKGISSFQALCTALAGRVGTGNIAGTATAIFYGGPGALFWMWMSAFLGASSAYMEAALAQAYKIELDGQYRGGPAYYILRGLNNTKFARAYAMIFSISTLIACGLLLPGVQSNAIADAFNNSMQVNTYITGAVVAVILGLIIFGGIRRIAAAAELIVPFMAVIYIIMALIIIAVNISKFGSVLGMIFSSAFSANAIFGGLFGSAIAWGVKRGIYSNEAGQGTAPHAAAAAEVSHPAKQGLVQAFSVYIDTLFVCSATGFMMLMTDSYNVLSPESNAAGVIAGSQGATFLHEGATVTDLAANGSVGVPFTQAGVSTVFSNWGSIFVAICLAFFAFTTIMAYYYQAESNFAYIFREKKSTLRKAVTLVLRLCMVVVVFFSASMHSTEAWNLGDVGVGLMAWINIIALWILQSKGFLLLRDYEQQYKSGIDPVFDPEKLGFKNTEIWKQINADRLKG